jgi:hypothetical protein
VHRVLLFPAGEVAARHQGMNDGQATMPALVRVGPAIRTSTATSLSTLAIPRERVAAQWPQVMSRTRKVIIACPFGVMQQLSTFT